MGLKWANFTQITFKQDYCKSLEKTENIPMVNLVSIEDIYEVETSLDHFNYIRF